MIANELCHLFVEQIEIGGKKEGEKENNLPVFNSIFGNFD